MSLQLATLEQLELAVRPVVRDVPVQTVYLVLMESPDHLEIQANLGELEVRAI